MPTATPVLDKRYPTKKGFPIKIKVYNKQNQRMIRVGYSIQGNQWKDGGVIKHKDALKINAAISDKLNEIHEYFLDCQKKNRPIKLDLIGKQNYSHSFCDYLTFRAKQYLAKDQIVMDRKLRRFVKELKACFGGDVTFDDLNSSTLRDYEAYLIKEENIDNTRNKKFKFLRHYYQHAIEEGKVEGQNPFKKYHISTRPVVKEKLTVQEVAALEALNLQPGPLNDARNIWLFSYYCKGMRYANCVVLDHKQIKGGRVIFVSNKGKKPLTTKIHPRLQAILDQYKGKGLIFPFIKELPTNVKDLLGAVDSNNAIVNRHLKTLARLAGIEKNLTMHVARHTIAQHMKENIASIHAIKEALGHSDTRTTEMYLKSLGDETIDSEMEKIYGK